VNLLKIGHQKYHLSHHFDKYNGVNLLVGENKPGVGGEPLAGQDLRPKNSVYPKGSLHFSFFIYLIRLLAINLTFVSI